MSILSLHFVDADGRKLDDFDLPSNVPIIQMLPLILAELGLSTTENWRLLLSEENREVDANNTFDQAGVRNGSQLQLTTGVRKIGRYEIIEEIGRGGMGIVYKAHDRHLDKILALKVIQLEGRDLSADAKLAERFLQEARAVAKLSGHPNVATVHDFGTFEDDGKSIPFFTMDYVDGISLDLLIHQRNALTVEETADILDGVASALDAVHALKIIHRDMKPSNILLSQDAFGYWMPKLLDLGLVKSQDAPTNLTQTAMILGSPIYMSPEQAKSAPLTHKTDIYSLGVVVYHMLAGRPPFDGIATTQILMAHVTQAPPPITSLQPLPKSVEAIVFRALAKEPEDRYESAGEFAKAFRIAMRPTVPEKKKFPWKWITIGLAVFAFIVVIAGLTFLLPPSTRRLLRQADAAIAIDDLAGAEESCREILVNKPHNEDGLACINTVAKVYRDQGELNEAKRIYRLVLSDYASDNKDAEQGWIEVVSEQAWSFLDEGACAKASKMFTEVLATAEDHPTAAMGKGESEFCLGNYTASIPYYEEAAAAEQLAEQARTKIAWAYYYIEQYEDAIPEFRLLTSTSPIDAYRGQTLCYVALGEKWYPEALSAAGQWAALEPTRGEPYSYLGQIYEGLGDTDKAIAAYERWVQLSPEDTRAYLGLGRTLRENENYAEAIVVFEQSIELEDSAYAYEGLGASYYASENYDEALKAYRHGADLEPSNAALHSLVGLALFRLEEYEEAAEAYMASIDLQESVKAYDGLGKCYTQLGDHEKARSAYERWVDLEPENWGAHSSLGWAQYRLGLYMEAVTSFEQAIELGGNSRVYEGLGASHYAMGSYSNALEAYQGGVELQPDSTALHNLVGLAQYRLQQFDGAIETYKKSLDLEATPKAYEGLGKCYYELGDYEQAQEAYQEWVEIAPNSGAALVSLGWAQYRLGDSEAATTSFIKSLNIENSAQAHAGLAGILHEQQNYTEALNEYQKWAAAAPQDPFAHNMLGWTYVKLGDCTNAKVAFERALELDESLTSATDGLKKCP